MHEDDEFAFARLMGNLGVRPTGPVPKRDPLKRQTSAAADNAAEEEFEAAMSSTRVVLDKDAQKGPIAESKGARKVTYTDRAAPSVGATTDLRTPGTVRPESIERDLRAFLAACYTDQIRAALVVTGPSEVRRVVERVLTIEQRGYAERWGEAPPSLGGNNAILIEVVRRATAEPPKGAGLRAPPRTGGRS